MLYALIALVVIAAAAAIYFLAGKKPKEPAYDDQGIPAGLEEEYKVALDPGSDGIALMYDLTTCRHCVHMHNFLDEHKIPHHQIFVDKYKDAARAAILAKLKEYNPRGSFPTLVIPGGKVVVGFREAQLREALGMEAAE